MKKIMLLFIFSILLINIVQAGTIYTLSNLEENPKQTAILRPGDGVYFSLKGYDHNLLVREVGKTTGVKIEIFRENEVIGSTIINTNSYFVLDTDEDNTSDLKIRLLDANNETIRISFELIQDETNQTEEETNTPTEVKGKFNKNTAWLIFASIIVIGLLIFYFINKKSK